MRRSARQQYIAEFLQAAEPLVRKEFASRLRQEIDGSTAEELRQRFGVELQDLEPAEAEERLRRHFTGWLEESVKQELEEQIRRRFPRGIHHSRSVRDALEEVSSEFDLDLLDEAIVTALLPCMKCGRYAVLARAEGGVLKPSRGRALPSAESVAGSLRSLLASGIYPDRWGCAFMQYRRREPTEINRAIVLQRMGVLQSLGKIRQDPVPKATKTRWHDTPSWLNYIEALDEAEAAGEDLWKAVNRLWEAAPKCAGCGVPMIGFKPDPRRKYCPESPSCRQRALRARRASADRS